MRGLAHASDGAVLQTLAPGTRTTPPVRAARGGPVLLVARGSAKPPATRSAVTRRPSSLLAQPGLLAAAPASKTARLLMCAVASQANAAIFVRMRPGTAPLPSEIRSEPTGLFLLVSPVLQDPRASVSKTLKALAYSSAADRRIKQAMVKRERATRRQSQHTWRLRGSAGEVTVLEASAVRSLCKRNITASFHLSGASRTITPFPL